MYLKENNMNGSKSLFFVLGAATAALLVWTFAFRKTQPELPAAGAESALDVIMSRTSIRSYEDRAVGEETVEQLLRAAMAAPSASNRQPWAFVVVDDRELLRQMAEKLPYAKMAAEAPLAIVVCGDLSKGREPSDAWWVQDASAATENLLLAAHALGLGAVWTGLYPKSERVQIVREILELPGHIVPLCLVPVGYPAETPAPKEKWNPGNVRHNRWTE